MNEVMIEQDYFSRYFNQVTFFLVADFDMNFAFGFFSFFFL